MINFVVQLKTVCSNFLFFDLFFSCLWLTFFVSFCLLLLPSSSFLFLSLPSTFLLPSFYLLLSSLLTKHTHITGKVLSNFQETGPFYFPPTFKVERGTPNLTDYIHKRIPSYCDRILYTSNTERSKRRIKCTLFESVPSSTTSDHKPVRARFQVQLNEAPRLLPSVRGETPFGGGGEGGGGEGGGGGGGGTLLSEEGRRDNKSSSSTGTRTHRTSSSVALLSKRSSKSTMKRKFSVDETIIIINIHQLRCDHLPQNDHHTINDTCVKYVLSCSSLGVVVSLLISE